MRASTGWASLINCPCIRMSYCFISNPVSSLPVVKNILAQFGRYSGYKFNFHRSELLPISASSKNLLWPFHPFRSTLYGHEWTSIGSSKHSLHSLLTTRLPLKLHDISQNPVVSHSLKIWTQFRKHFGLDEPSTLVPVFKNNLFPPS